LIRKPRTSIHYSAVKVPGRSACLA